MFYSCAVHIIHYDFYYYEGTWRTKRMRENEENIFHESRLLQVTNLLSGLHFSLSLTLVSATRFVWFPPARYKSKYLYADLSMFYFVICCGAFGAHKLLWLFARSKGIKVLSMKIESLWNFFSLLLRFH